MNKIAPVLLGSGMMILGVLPSAQGAGIGVVAGLRGDATVRREQVTQAQRLKFKDDLFWQDTLSTGADAQLRLLILQKSVITMKELTQLQLREELVSPNQPKKKSVVELVSGAVRVAVDKDVLKESDYEVRTNMAVAAIRGSDLFGQTGSDRVEICTGPGSSVTVIHHDPAVGRREVFNLQCALLFPNRIEVRIITHDFYRTLTSIGPSGSQNPNNTGSGNAKITTASPAGVLGGFGGGPQSDAKDFYSKNNGGCLLCKPQKTTSLGPPN